MIRKVEVLEIIEIGKKLPKRPWGYRLQNGDAFITDSLGNEILFNDETAQFVLACINNFESLSKGVVDA